jgi:predicted SnoaL-like aldol condensation-catalyzing enzyme
MTDQLEQNKQIVARIFNMLAGSGEDIGQVIDELVPAEGYIQHNDLAGEGPEGLKEYLPTLMRRTPTPEDDVPDWLDITQTVSVNFIAEGDFVVRHEIRKHGELIDIFRVSDGFVREHWDAFRPYPGTERIPGF